MREVYLIDTTLRDGLQGTSRNVDHEDAAALARALVDAGVGEIEAGVAVRPDDRERIRVLRQALPEARLAVWCRLRRDDLGAASDTGVDVVHLSVLGSDRLLAAFGRDRRWRAQSLMRLLPLARDRFSIVSLGVQDAAGVDARALRDIVHIARNEGVTRLRLADSPGRWLPNQAARCVARLLPLAGNLELGIHAHDDLGLATAVSLAALDAGAACCDVTLCGVGERAGNAALEQVALACHAAGIHTRIRTRHLRDLAQVGMRVVGRAVPPDQPIVGDACFSHQSGLHQAAMTRDPGCYEPFSPAQVGAQRTESVGRHTGRAGLQRALERLGLRADAASATALLPAVIEASAQRGRALTDDELHALARANHFTSPEGREPWSSTSLPTTSSSATASASPARPREPARARTRPSSRSISKKSSPIEGSTPSSRPRVA